MSIKPIDLAKDWRRGVDYIGVTVCFLVHDGNGSILMQQRGPLARDERGAWDIGGGAVEFGETLDAAVRREVEEELCTIPLEVQFLDSGEAHRVNDGTPTHWIYMLHAVKINPEEAKIGEPGKISQLGWFNKDNLPEPLHSQFHKSLPIAIEAGILL